MPVNNSQILLESAWSNLTGSFIGSLPMFSSTRPIILAHLACLPHILHAWSPLPLSPALCPSPGWEAGDGEEVPSGKAWRGSWPGAKGSVHFFLEVLLGLCSWLWPPIMSDSGDLALVPAQGFSGKCEWFRPPLKPSRTPWTTPTLPFKLPLCTETSAQGSATEQRPLVERWVPALTP